MFVDLVFDLIGLVRHEYAAIGVACAHFGLGTLKSREEFGVDQSWLGVLELWGNVASEAEIRILVNGAGDEAGNVGSSAEDLREGRGKARGSLDCRKVDFANVVTDDWLVDRKFHFFFTLTIL